MNSLKRFLAVSVLAAAGIASALACGPWGRPHYYVFSAYQRNQLGSTFTPRMEQFWFDYAPEVKAKSYEISYLSSIATDEFDTSDNTIIKTAREKKDKEMLDYLRLLTQYLQICDMYTGNEWNYPSKEELAQGQKTLKYINYNARSYSGTRLAGQYRLLAMRTNMVMGEHAANITYWNNHKDKLKPSVYKDMMKDIYAGALLNMGQTDEAASIYYELGDMSSLMWIMRDQRNLDGIKKEYARNPNSPALVYLVQDMANNLSDSRYYIDVDEDKESLAQNTRETKAFIDFAQKVLKDNKTQCPALWQSAMGWLNFSLGNNKDAVSQLDKAMKMKGTDRMHDNARVCRLVATACSEKPDKKTLAFLKQEMQWVIEKEKTEPADAGMTMYTEGCHNHYTEVLQNLIYDHLAPLYKKQGYSNIATALIGWMDKHTDNASDYWTAIDDLTSQQMIDYYGYIKGKPATEFEAWIIADIDMDANKFNDMVGTKMIREGKFADAIPYLEKVPISYLRTQAIAPYSSVRDYRVAMCFTRQYNDAGFSDNEYNIKSNQKLDFCKEAVALINKINTLSDGKEKAEAAFTLANIYLQASFKGNCWYLSRYGNSVYDEMRYEGEFDFLAQAAQLYKLALSQPGTSNKDKLPYYYAAAYLPYGESWRSYEYDENYNLNPVVHKDSYQYIMLNELNKFVSANPHNTASYVTGCDVLRQFRAAL